MMLNFPLINQLNIDSQEDLEKVIDLLRRAVANEGDDDSSELKVETTSKDTGRHLD